MSRRRRVAPGRSAPPAHGQRAGTLLAFGLLAVALVAVVVVWRGRESAPAPAAADSLAALAPQELIARATALVDGGSAASSLPIYRRLVALSGGTNASVHCAYGVALYDALFEADTIAGVGRPVWRTSDARAARMNDCLAQLDSAIALARTPLERAGFEERRAIMLDVWGFPWDAEASFRAAASDDPGNAAFASRPREYRALLLDPVRASWQAQTALR